jgi:hypothetical protein
MRHCLGMGALAAVFLASACSAPPDTYSDPGPDEEEEGEPPAEADAAVEAEEPAIRFAGSQEAADSGDFQSEFGLLEHRDIYAVFEIPDAPGVQFVRFDIYNRHDVLHQTIWRAISSDGNPPETVEHPEIGQMMPVERVQSAGGEVRVHLAIPIAGTNFTQFRLTGTFAAHAWLGMGEGEPLLSGAFALIR